MEPSEQRGLVDVRALEDDAQEVVRLVVDRAAQWSQTRPPLTLRTDRRDFSQEALEEVIDGLFYCGALLLRLQRWMAEEAATNPDGWKGTG